MNLLSVGLVLVCIAVSADSVSGNFQNVGACVDKCPTYSVIDMATDYSTRMYDPSRWATTEGSSNEYARIFRTNFMKLNQYFTGKNDRDENMGMTRPIITKVFRTPGSAQRFITSFFIPTEVSNPPTPTDPTIQLSNLPLMKVYVRTLQESMSLNELLLRANDLASTLMRQKKRFDDSFFYYAVYQNPLSTFRQVTEIWFTATD